MSIGSDIASIYPILIWLVSYNMIHIVSIDICWVRNPYKLSKVFPHSTYGYYTENLWPFASFDAEVSTILPENFSSNLEFLLINLN